MEKHLMVALMILSLHRSWVNSEDSVEQSPRTLTIQEGMNATFYCNYSSRGSDYLHWYRQDLRKSLVNLFVLITSGEVKHNGRLTVTLNTKDQQSSLHITASQPEDSATYLCASHGAAGSKFTFGKGTQLRVKPNITDPQPALYQLTSPKSSDTSVCLLTDFDSSNKYANSNDSTVLEMMTMESKSYGAVIWGSKSSFNCTNAFQQNIVNLTQPSGSTCKVKDVKQSFETDKDLNLMNMFLIFLRVIFLKTAGFNLLMTLRLWSN